MLVRIEEIRDFRALSLSPVDLPSKIFLHGENASGKTSFLEALYLACRRSSFRASDYKQLFKIGADAFRIKIKTEDSFLSNVTITGGIKNSIKFNAGINANLSKKEQIRKMPCSILNHGTVEFFFSTPSSRRMLCDWLSFYIDVWFIDAWSKYKAALKNRNYLLKQMQYFELEAWNHLLLDYGLLVMQKREHAMHLLIERLNEINDIYGFFSGKFSYKMSLLDRDAYREYLFDKRYFKENYTRKGAHAVDIHLFLEGNEILPYTSRGRCKLLLALILFALSEVIYTQVGSRPLLLIDDFFAELDQKTAIQLEQLMQNYPYQLIVTSLMPATLLKGKGANMAVWRIEKGTLFLE